MKLLEKLNAIMSEADYIQKDKRNAFHNYNYASEQAIKEKLHPLFVKHGVIMFPLQVSQVRTQNGEGKERECFSDVSIKFRLYDCETGEYFEGEGCGTGSDKPGDKAVYKAWTGALKYILTTMFLIPTGDDAEADEPQPEKRKPERKEAPAKPIPAEPISQEPLREDPQLTAEEKAEASRLFNKVRSDFTILKMKPDKTGKPYTEPHLFRVIEIATHEECHNIADLRDRLTHLRAVSVEFERRIRESNQ